MKLDNVKKLYNNKQNLKSKSNKFASESKNNNKYKSPDSITTAGQKTKPKVCKKPNSSINVYKDNSKSVKAKNIDYTMKRNRKNSNKWVKLIILKRHYKK